MKHIYRTLTVVISLLLINNLAFGSKGSLPSDLDKWLENFSEEQTDSLYAMHELWTLHESPYAVGETFCLQTSNSECETVTVKEVLGGGGSKKAVLLEDGRVLMFPNTDVDHFVNIANWWPNTVTKEAAMADYLEEIDIPALNREKGYLIIPSKENSEKSYKLPVLVADSFEQYADRGWFILDCKTSSSIYPKEKWKKDWGTSLESWDNTFDLLIRDLWTLALNGVCPGRDARNFVLIKGDDGSFDLRYFGFDFGGKYGTATPPSSEERLELANMTHQEICSIMSYHVKYMVRYFITEILLPFPWPPETDIYAAYSASEDISEYYSSCEYITEVISSPDVPKHDLTEL